jgi:hypothetical protein
LQKEQRISDLQLFVPQDGQLPARSGRLGRMLCRRSRPGECGTPASVDYRGLAIYRKFYRPATLFR